MGRYLWPPGWELGLAGWEPGEPPDGPAKRKSSSAFERPHKQICLLAGRHYTLPREQHTRTRTLGSQNEPIHQYGWLANANKPIGFSSLARAKAKEMRTANKWLALFAV